ncbi:MAG: dihydropteroate synthase [Spirochaetales bacterium]|nr:dihydropteroate synthase [Spirochaetales bacterium]
MLDFKNHPLIMGVINTTPDSFFPASRTPDLKSALSRAEEMITAGADILDIGGESTRPGSDSVSAETEIGRVIPLVRKLKKNHDILISIDTQKLAVAKAALSAGADIVNTVSGLRDDDDFAYFIARQQVPVIIMHMRGSPKTMQNNPNYGDTISEITHELEELVQHALACGINHNRIIIDPGIGFGKRLHDNLLIIKHLKKIKALGYPVLIGISRKSFLGLILDKPVAQRLIGTITANTIAVLNGADIIRVHDIEEASEMKKVIRAIEDSD